MRIPGLSPLRRRQLGTIVRLELGKNLRSWRGLWLYLLALLPVLPIGLHTVGTLLRSGGPGHVLDQDTNVLAAIFQLYYLRLGIFFGCLGLFTRLFRGEMMERSLHHYLLSPVRRELLTIGKFLAGLIISLATFGLAVLLAFVLMYVHFGAEARSFLAGPGLGHLGSYLLVTALACLGYGSLFMLLGLVAKNPILPAVPILLWESMNHLLPSALKPFSVVFYLEPLLPVEVPPANELLTFFAIPADPVSAAIAVPGLVLVSAAILVAACLRARTTEINYSE